MSFSTNFNSGFKQLVLLTYHFVFFFGAQLSGDFLILPLSRKGSKLDFSIFCVLSLNFEISLF